MRISLNTINQPLIAVAVHLQLFFSRNVRKVYMDHNKLRSCSYYIVERDLKGIVPQRCITNGMLEVLLVLETVYGQSVLQMTMTIGFHFLNKLMFYSNLFFIILIIDINL